MDNVKVLLSMQSNWSTHTLLVKDGNNFDKSVAVSWILKFPFNPSEMETYAQISDCVEQFDL